jgi:hypothetical protein
VNPKHLLLISSALFQADRLLCKQVTVSRENQQKILPADLNTAIRLGFVAHSIETPRRLCNSIVS